VDNNPGPTWPAQASATAGPVFAVAIGCAQRLAITSTAAAAACERPLAWSQNAHS
jgi:hypothetical protein